MSVCVVGGWLVAGMVEGVQPSGQMQRVVDAEQALAWLSDRPSEEAMTGYAPVGWDASMWVLHAMYENPSLRGLGSHDDVHRARLTAGTVAPPIIGDVNLEGTTTVSGTPLGFVISPGSGWVRVRWSQYLDRFPEFEPDRSGPPSDRWRHPPTTVTGCPGPRRVHPRRCRSPHLEPAVRPHQADTRRHPDHHLGHHHRTDPDRYRTRRQRP
jgi:hypothetical protein